MDSEREIRRKASVVHAYVFRRPNNIGYRPLFAFALALSSTLLTPHSVQGAQQDESKAVARALASDGAKAFRAGRWEEAIDYLTRAEKTYHAPTHLLYVARAYEKLGKLILAQETYLKIIREELDKTSPPPYREAQRDAKAELIGVERRIATLTIEFEDGKEIPGVQVSLDGTPLSTALLGVGRPVDPGAHHVEATAEGWKPDSSTFNLGDGQKRTVVLHLEPLPKPQALPPPAAVTRSVSLPPRRQEPFDLEVPESSDNGSPALRVSSFVLGGLSLAAIGTGTYLFAKQLPYARKADELDKICESPTGCTEEQQADRRRNDDLAREPWLFSKIFLISGGAGLAASATMFILSQPSSPPIQQGFQVKPWIGITSAGVRGQF